MTAMLRSSRSTNWHLNNALCAGLIAALTGCPSGDGGVPDEALGGLVVAPANQERAIDMERLRKHPDELLRAAQLSHAQIATKLGSHRFTGSVKIEVKEDDAVVESLDVTTHIELAADGSYQARSENSREYGRQVIFKDGALYLAPRYSRFHKRAPESDAEPVEIRNDMYQELAAHLELIQRGINVEDRGSGRRDDGRDVRTLGIVKAAADRPVSQPERLSQRKWRDAIAVTEASGELAVDVQTGAVLHAEVRAGVTFTRDDRRFTMTFDIVHDIADIGADIAIAAPPDDRWVPTPLRRTEVEMRDRLLEGIAPPTRKFEPKPAEDGDSAAGAGQGDAP